ncbi:MAG: glycosyl hydrolase family 59, partial [Ruminococcus sp.]
MSLHFSQFIQKGWAFVEDACYADGVAGGDGHAIVDATYSFMTAADTETGDYSTVITNTTAEPITYNFTVKNLDKASANAYVWETRGPDSGAWNENYFRMRETITPEVHDGSYTYAVTVQPYSMVTVSTVERSQSEYEYEEQTSEILALPYTDDFEYADYPETYLSSRGNAPRYTTDEGGAFEVQHVNGSNVLMQMITPDIKAEEWGYTPNPTTNFGDDRWYNYSVSADVQLTESDTPEENYAGIGLRYHLASAGESGYWISVYENGAWKLNQGKGTVAEGTLSDFDSSVWHHLKIQAVDAAVTAWIDGTEITSYHGIPSCGAGRAAFYSSWNNNCFDNVAVESVETADSYITRFDNTDTAFSYTGNWTHNTMSSFSNYKRTISEGTEGAVMTFTFHGTGFALTGASKEMGFSVKVDGETAAEKQELVSVGNRAVIYEMSGLEEKDHTVEVTVLSGTFAIDGAQVTGMPVVLTSDKAKDSTHTEQKNRKKNILYAVAGGALLFAAGGITAAAIIRRKRKK